MRSEGSTIQRHTADGSTCDRHSICSLDGQRAKPEVGPRRCLIGQVCEVGTRGQLACKAVGDGTCEVGIIAQGSGQLVQGVQRAGGCIDQSSNRRLNKCGARNLGCIGAT